MLSVFATYDSEEDQKEAEDNFGPRPLFGKGILILIGQRRVKHVGDKVFVIHIFRVPLAEEKDLAFNL